MKPSTTAERLQEAMNIRGLKQVDVLRLAEPYCRAYGVNLGKTALTQYVSGKIVPRQDKLTILGLTKRELGEHSTIDMVGSVFVLFCSLPKIRK